MAARYTLVIGTKDWSSWSLRPYMALRHIGVPFEEDLIALRRNSTTEEVQKRSPSGRVPLLRIEENGQAWSVWDSLAICETLAERHPQAKLWPDAPRARAEARAVSAEMHSGFPDVRDQMTMDFARKLPTPDLRDTTKAQIARILKIWTDALAAHGGPFLFGDFSIADCMYAPVCSRFRTYGIDMPDAAQAYVDRMFALPAMVDWGRDAKKEVEEGLA
ncbi:MAG TPA: glutathione S-transferase C-terminal domain-containing protein [Rhizomicrobium sp.]|jgi:glutathione S-transferase|nr:glutathione S-transferase C-terminal domain-containing protein [Rhizomicrobium sp.]